MSLTMKFTEDKTHVFSGKLLGSLDESSYLDLEDKLKSIIDDDTKAVVLDMGDVDYVRNK